MNNLLKKILLLTCIVLLVAQSCYKDKGNYDYAVLDQILIDTSVNDIKNSYAVFRYEVLNITPDIYLNGEKINSIDQVKDKLAFNWSIYQAVSGGTVHTRDTLSSDLKLSSPITKPEGLWNIVLSIRDLDTQVETYQYFQVDISENISDGWMVLYEKDNTTDVGLIVDSRVKTGMLQSRLFLDLLRNTNEEALPGKPKALLHSVAPLGSGEILVASEQELIAVNRSDFQEALVFDELFWASSRPTGKNIKALNASNARKEVIINNNKFHIANFISSGAFRTNFFGPAIGGSYGELADWLATFPASTFDAVAYDKTGRKFVNVPTNSTSSGGFVPQNASSIDLNNIGLDFVANDWGNLNYEYFVMKGGNIPYLLILNLGSLIPANIALQKIDISNSPDAVNINSITSAVLGQYLLYSTPSQVALLKYNTGSAAETLWTPPSGEEVTCIRLQKFYALSIQAARLPNPHQYVYFATWNETTKNGKVYSYKIDPSNGIIDTSTEVTYEGFGKIKDMSYKWIL
ncbi:hypothetical protein FAZ15_01750 [Sphingobacterium olei]|uniref:PKD-like family protein n=1 Tax=Sphingobacterium olei TaxID=2571155 RepID=A0A4U0P6F9_9SPHI|nr:PKD-like family lipoprotein [Sphingobacterium olei]TJZ63046.1 hypothetical protein FAZ15_01750 [Sphingobacterium olei]